MKRTIVFGALVAVIAAGSVDAYDFAERPAALLFAEAPREFAVGAAGYAHSAYHANVFRNTRLDKFQVQAYAHHAIVDVPSARLGVYYGTFMLNGPVNEGDRPGADAAQWMMNAIQYEYGFVGAWYPPARGFEPAVLVEYGRRSYHPLRSSAGLEDPAADVIRLGAAARGLPVRGLSAAVGGDARLDLAARVGWTELYDFWGASSIPDPRAFFTAHLAAELTVDFAVGAIGRRAEDGRVAMRGAADDASARSWVPAGFVLLMPDLLWLREGGVDMDVAVQAGLRFGGRGHRRTQRSDQVSTDRRAAVELFLDYFRSGDTEQLKEGTAPATLVGYGIRFTLDL